MGRLTSSRCTLGCMRPWWGLLLVASCRLHFDVAPQADADATPSLLCDVSDARLMACYRFENGGADSSVHGNHATVSGVTFVPGVVGMAAQLTAGSSIQIAEDATLDFSTELTMEAWIRPTSFATAPFVLDNDYQYGVYLTSEGHLACSLVPYESYVGPEIPLDTWTHVACTYDGAALRLWIDGSEVAMVPVTGVLDQGSTTGLTLGADNPDGGFEFLGLLDQVALWRAALTAEELCRSADSC